MAIIKVDYGELAGGDTVLFDQEFDVTTGTQNFSTGININKAKNVIAFTTGHQYSASWARGGFWTIENGTPTVVCNSGNGAISISEDEIVVGVENLASSYIPCKLKVVITSA